MGGRGFFPVWKMGRLAGIVSGRAEPSRTVGKGDDHVQRSRRDKVGVGIARYCKWQEFQGRKKESEREKDGTETRCAATGKLVSGGDSDDSGGRNGGSGSR